MDVISLFKQLVSIDSPTGEEEEIAGFVAEFLENECGLEPTVDKYNNVFVYVEGEGEPVFFNAHLDTVQPGAGIVPVVEDGVIRSKGDTILGADNKASLAAILMALYDLVSRRKKHCPLDILFTVSEESGSVGAVNFDKSKISAKTGFIFDINRPVGTIVKAAPFYARFSIKVKGRPAHASRRHLAVPVIEPMLSVIGKIERLRTEKLLVNVGQISGGFARNTVMGAVEIEGELRSFYEDVFHGTIMLLDKIISSLDGVGEVKIDHEVVIENPGYVHTADDIEMVRNKVERVLGEKVEVVETLGCSDGNIFNGCPDLTVFELGDGGSGAHTTEESITVENLFLLQKLVKGLMEG